MITRIWRGRKELADKDYFIGQILIETGNYKGCYQSVTQEFDSEEEAAISLADNIVEVPE